MKKKAVISIDVEDWYHLEYFKDNLNDKLQSVIDEGTGEFLNILNKEDIKATFFVVGEIISSKLELLGKVIKSGHEIAGHSFYHTRPLTQSIEDFKLDSEKLIKELKLIQISTQLKLRLQKSKNCFSFLFFFAYSFCLLIR